jgi:branched-chain amino acid transport system substrate-binding protein
MNKTTQIIIGIIVAVIILAGIWYGVSKKPTAPTTKEPIKIGFIGPLSGDAASYGIPIKNAIALAVEEINNAGGINGRKIEIIYEDGKCNGKDAVNAAQKLINIDKVNIILGGMCSGELLAIAPITEPAKVLLLSPSASSPDITHAGDFIFRNNPSDADGGKALAKLVREKYTKAAIISENTDYAQALARVFVEHFRSLGGEVVAQENFDPGVKDFRTILTKIKASNPEALVINPQTEIAGGLIVKQAREIGITIPLYGTVALAGTKYDFCLSYSSFNFNWYLFDFSDFASAFGWVYWAFEFGAYCFLCYWCLYFGFIGFKWISFLVLFSFCRNFSNDFWIFTFSSYK